MSWSERGPIESGGIDGKGKGGDRVWRELLDPDEQRSLKEFFGTEKK